MTPGLHSAQAAYDAQLPPSCYAPDDGTAELREEVADLKDTLRRVAVEYVAFAGPNRCPAPPHACPKCEIYLLLEEWLPSDVGRGGGAA